MNFTKFPKISGSFIIFANFWGFWFLRENGHRFAPTLQNVVFPMVFYMYFGSFAPESLFAQNVEIPSKSANFIKFQEIPLNFVNFADFWSFGPKCQESSKIARSRQLFKAKMVVLWDVCPLFMKIVFLRPRPLFCENSVFRRNSALFGPKVHFFLVLGIQKHLPKADFI